ncbi:pVII [Great tit adenovirus 1]|uniref:PVII n=1 Tax=Great tit adenovirus 1 TaxID=676130 RepID=D0QX16_9ADEN|nr:pVII [Great tit adenovirus 1]ACW84427.1 pVII [Great tit adenovirus 1]
MTAVFYSPGDSRGWGLGSSSMRDYYLIGGALQPSDVYTVRVREHWRRKRGTRPPAAVIVPSSISAPRGRARKRAIAIPGRILRSRVVPPLPLPAPTTTAVVPAVPAGPVVVAAKRRRLG